MVKTGFEISQVKKRVPDMEISYTTSPLSNLLAHKFYEMLDIPVHSTKLGVYENKVVVACKDFSATGRQTL